MISSDLKLILSSMLSLGSMFVVEIFDLPFLDPDHNNTDYNVTQVNGFITFMMTIFEDKKPKEVADYYTKNLKNDDKDEMK